MTPKDYEIQNLRRENQRLADELSKAMVGLFWLRGKHRELEAQVQSVPETFIKGAETGILAYLSLMEGERPEVAEENITFKAPINTDLLKAALRLCSTMDADSICVKFEEVEDT